MAKAHLSSLDSDSSSFSLVEPSPQVFNLKTSPKEIEVSASERTPRKPANPHHTPVRDESDSSALLTFKFVDTELTPELNITTSSTPVSNAKKSKAKRRLWSDVCEPLVYIDLDIRQKNHQAEDSGRESSQSSPSEFEGEEKYSPLPLSVRDTNIPQTEIETDQKCYSLKCSRYSSKSKTCASCGTKKTPLWRDADDGTPYCNACGIRFKKYRVRCPSCLYIPRKDEKTNNSCFLCGFQLVRCRFSGPAM